MDDFIDVTLHYATAYATRVPRELVECDPDDPNYPTARSARAIREWVRNNTPPRHGSTVVVNDEEVQIETN